VAERTAPAGRAVRLGGLTVHLPRRAAPVLDRVDLEVADGEQLLVVGPSGCGKSTLLDVLSGVVPQGLPAEVVGDVLVAGQDPRHVPFARLALRVGRLGQDPAANACLPDVLDEVALTLENRGVPRAEIGPRVQDALRRVDALHLAGRRTSALSGGEQQRVALAAVLAGEPEVLLLDEPTSMLDPAAAHRVRQVLAARATGAPGTTTVLVEQRTGDAGWLPPRTVVLSPAGRVVADGPTGEVLPPDVLPAPRRPTAPGDVVVRLTDTAFRQGGREVVAVPGLELREGQVTVLVGCNGSGKSSLLLGAAGLLGGRGRRSAPAVALVVQRPEHQLLARSAAAEVAVGLPRRAPDRDAVAAAALEAVDLGHLAAADPFRMSGGEQRRLALAATAVLGRRVLLLDEPTAGLDPQRTADVAALVARAADDGCAVVLATHDLRLARALADQVVVLAAGEVVAQGGSEVLDDGAVLAAAGLVPLTAGWAA
jgi:energy-coupling factor transport system ATP-binding protein